MIKKLVTSALLIKNYIFLGTARQMHFCSNFVIFIQKWRRIIRF